MIGKSPHCTSTVRRSAPSNSMNRPTSVLASDATPETGLSRDFIWSTTRGTIVLLLAACATFNYLLRVSIGILLIPLARDLHWDRAQQGRFMSAFFVGYATLQMVGAWGSQRLGGKMVLGWAIIGWSGCIALIPSAAALGSGNLVYVCILLLGMFESPIMPTLSHLQSVWLLPSEFSRAAAVVQTGCTVGTIAANLMTPLLIGWIGYKAVLLLYSVFGLGLAMVWYCWAADAPTCCSHIDKTELDLLRNASPSAQAAAGGWLSDWRMLVSPAAIAIYVAHLASTWANYMLISWLPTYFVDQLHTNPDHLSVYLTVPPVASIFGALSACAYADSWVGSMPSQTPHVRRLFLAVGYGGAAVFLGLFVRCAAASWASVSLTGFYFFAGVSVAGYSAAYLDLGKASAGVLQGVGNTLATISGIVCGPIVSGVLSAGGTWTHLFGSASFLLVFSVLVFHLLYTRSKVSSEDMKDDEELGLVSGSQGNYGGISE